MMDRKNLAILLLAFTSAIVAAAPGSVESENHEQVSSQREGESQQQTNQRDEEKGKLHVITINQEKIEGEYYGLTEGIHFLSELRGNLHFLSVVKTNGDPLMIVKQIQPSNILMSVADTDFLIMENPPNSVLPKHSDYVIPKAFQKHVETAVKRNQISKQILRQLDDVNVNESRRSAFEQLVLHPEVELITEAAQALSHLGVRARENPAVLSFYTLARLLGRPRASLPNTGYDQRSHHPQKRSLCPYGQLPYYGYGPDCLGMCGPGCTCWESVCDDCCVHRGCYDHDLCCDSYFSYGCYSAIWRFDEDNCSSGWSC